MPEAVIFKYLNKTHTVYFTQPNALLPVKLSNEQIRLVTWGRRQSENSEMPLGGWARLNSIQERKWQLYRARPVRIPLTRFMEVDFEGNCHWYDLTKDQWVQGLLAKSENEYRIYIVTITPQAHDVYHDRFLKN